MTLKELQLTAKPIIIRLKRTPNAWRFRWIIWIWFCVIFLQC